ncbi:MAG: carboxypeptidase regulatory-like domain-containing protein, partial [Thermoplasmata archaeon]|nr:carboxypeptidase regulatory-like domain-containing protein [Thermoplasmata archaeon]
RRFFRIDSYDTVGDYSFCIWAADDSYNWMSACGEVRIRDSLPPDISDTNADPSPQEVFGTVNVSARVVDNYLLEQVGIQVFDPTGLLVGNFTMEYDPSTGLYYYSMPCPVLGNYTFTIWAKDSSDNWASSSGMFVVRDTTPPDADAGSYQEIMFGDTVSFDGSGSSDNFGIDSYVWTFNDGIEDVVLYGVSPEHTFDEPGNYTVTLTVTDTSGNSGQDIVHVNVSAEKIPSPPTDLVISQMGGDFFILTWNAPTTNTDGSELTNLKSYCVYRSLQSGGPYTKIGTLIILNELYKDGGLDSGFTGYYVVTAINSEGVESAYSNEASAKIPEKGSISGSIIDENGDPVPGATVELKKDDSRILAVPSNEKGNFSIADLDDGAYEVVINKHPQLCFQ